MRQSPRCQRHLRSGGLQNHRSRVRILPPLPTHIFEPDADKKTASRWPRGLRCPLDSLTVSAPQSSLRHHRPLRPVRAGYHLLCGSVRPWRMEPARDRTSRGKGRDQNAVLFSLNACLTSASQAQRVTVRERSGFRSQMSRVAMIDSVPTVMASALTRRSVGS